MQGYLHIEFAPAIDDDGIEGYGTRVSAGLKSVTGPEKLVVIRSVMEALKFSELDTLVLATMLLGDKELFETEVSHPSEEEFIRSVMRGTVKEAMGDEG